MAKLVSIDVGGTNARFALAEVADGRVVALGEATTLKTADHASFELAYERYRQAIGTLPAAAAIAFAGPVKGETIQLTNSPWVIRPGTLKATLRLDALTIVNDFGAVGHAVAQAGPEHLRHLCGPDTPLPGEGTIAIVGPGTGLGVAHVLRRGGEYFVSETEGGHLDFAPVDTVEDQILAFLRARYRRVSAERIVSGPGLRNLAEALAAVDDQPASLPRDDVALWTMALDGSDPLATAALHRFFLSFGTFAGDIALAQGAAAVVIAGGLGQRIADHIPASGFAQRFVAKGRFERMMAAMPVRLITHPQPGLYGAAAAFAQAHR